MIYQEPPKKPSQAASACQESACQAHRGTWMHHAAATQPCCKSAHKKWRAAAVEVQRCKRCVPQGGYCCLHSHFWHTQLILHLRMVLLKPSAVESWWTHCSSSVETGVFTSAGQWAETEEDSTVALWRNAVSGVVILICWKLIVQNLSNQSGTSHHLLL